MGKSAHGTWRAVADPCHFDTISTVVDDAGNVVAQVGGRTDTAAT